VRELLVAGQARGCAVGLWLDACEGDPTGRLLRLTDGSVDPGIRTHVPDAELQPAWRALAQAVPATAPLVVFGGEDRLRRAVLAWPEARAAWAGDGVAASQLLDRATAVQAARTWEVPDPGLTADQLARWTALPPAPAGPGTWLHPTGSGTGWGTEALLGALESTGTHRAMVRVVWVGVEAPDPALRRRAEALGCTWSEGRGEAALAEHATGATAWVLPWTRSVDAGLLLQALASGRPVAATRAGITADVLGAEGICLPIAGLSLGTPLRHSVCTDEVVIEPRSLVWALAQLECDGARAAHLAMVQRARAHVVTHHGPRPRPMPVVPRVLSGRPKVVLEAPLLEVSSTSELTIETARALLERDRVDLSLVVTTPSRGSYEALRDRAPELLEHLVRRPGACDLWLSSGWPARLTRPDAGVHVVRVDWEYGALPTALMGPLQHADRILVHSRAVRRVVHAAGFPLEKVFAAGHGVGREFSAEGPVDDRVRAFKGEQIALLFVGGLVWRKGFDLWMRTLLQLRAQGLPVCGVIKSMGGGTHYAGFHMAELVRKVQADPRAPGLLHLEDPMSREELAAVYRACDVLVHPYRGEGFGMPVLEAMASGLPAVVTRGGATDDFCRPVPTVVRVASKRRYCELEGPHRGPTWVLEPDAEELETETARVVRGLGAISAQAKVLAPHIGVACSWDHAAASIEALAFDATRERAGVVRGPTRVARATNEPGLLLARAAAKGRLVQLTNPVR